MKELGNCKICPRECGIDRYSGKKGYCGCDAGFNVASVCLHRGEEPAVNGLIGICNVFFAGCNLRCSFCQNIQISRRKNFSNQLRNDLSAITDEIINYLDKGVEAVGFVSPSHQVPHVKALINALHERNYFPVTVYNTNAYDKAEILKDLEGIIDVYLPDFKYMDHGISARFSDAVNYPETACSAIREMYRQKGSTVVLNENGQAVTGLIIRHLVMPGQTSDSIKIMEWIAQELSPSVHVSLMSQYYPTSAVTGHPVLGRKITPEEYNEVKKAMEDLGFYRGWVQEYESPAHYQPDFDRDNPFEN